MRPVVSVVIPAHNRADVIGAALESVLSQSGPPFEVVVSDDASEDGTRDALRAAAARDPRVRWLALDRRGGAQAARNAAIRASHGEWIAFLDSDDTWLPGALERRFARAAHEGVEVVHAEALVKTAASAEPAPFGIPPLQGDVYAAVLSAPGPIFQCLLASRRALDTIGLLDEAITAFQEWDTAIRLARHHWFGFEPEPVALYDRTRADAISRDPARDIRGYLQVFKKHRPEIWRVGGRVAVAEHHLALASKLRWQRRWIGVAPHVGVAATLWPAGVVARSVASIRARWWPIRGRLTP